MQHRILFSHLHLCEGLVIVADVEQPESLGKHTTKRGKNHLAPVSSTASRKKKKNMQRFQFSASNRNQNCEITPLPTLLFPHSLIKN